MITYPVDVENTRWSAVRISTGEIVKHNRKWPRADGGEIVALDSDIALLLEVEEAQPSYDPATERLQRTAPVIDIPNNTHTHGWEVVARDQADIDDDAEREQIKAVYLALKNHQGTSAQRMNRVETVLARVLKDTYGSA